MNGAHDNKKQANIDCRRPKTIQNFQYPFVCNLISNLEMHFGSGYDAATWTFKPQNYSGSRRQRNGPKLIDHDNWTPKSQITPSSLQPSSHPPIHLISVLVKPNIPCSKSTNTLTIIWENIKSTEPIATDQKTHIISSTILSKLLFSINKCTLVVSGYNREH